MSIEEDWDRLKRAFDKVKMDHWDPSVKLFISPKELRHADNRGIDEVIRRLLNDPRYETKIKLYGCPPHLVPRNPFRYKGRSYALLRIEE